MKDELRLPRNINVILQQKGKMKHNTNEQHPLTDILP